jgi:hypothetical protein
MAGRLMADFDVARLRAHWSRSLPRVASCVQQENPSPGVEETGPGDATSLLDELRELVEAGCGRRYPILGTLLSEARACCVVLSSDAGAAAVPAATRLLELVEQLEDLLEVYDGVGLAR